MAGAVDYGFETIDEREVELGVEDPFAVEQGPRQELAARRHDARVAAAELELAQVRATLFLQELRLAALAGQLDEGFFQQASARLAQR